MLPDGGHVDRTLIDRVASEEEADQRFVPHPVANALFSGFHHDLYWGLPTALLTTVAPLMFASIAQQSGEVVVVGCHVDAILLAVAAVASRPRFNVEAHRVSDRERAVSPWEYRIAGFAGGNQRLAHNDATLIAGNKVVVIRSPPSTCDFGFIKSRIASEANSAVELLDLSTEDMSLPRAATLIIPAEALHWFATKDYSPDLGCSGDIWILGDVQNSQGALSFVPVMPNRLTRKSFQIAFVADGVILWRVTGASLPT